MKKKPTHGGKRNGAGRKPVPDDERRDVVVRIRVTEAQWNTLLLVQRSRFCDLRHILLEGATAVMLSRR